MVTYFPNATNSTDFLRLMQFANRSDVTAGLFAPVTLLSVWSIVFFSLGMYPKEKAFAAANFISMLVCALFYALDMVSGWVTMLVIVLFLVSAVMLFFTTD